MSKKNESNVEDKKNEEKNKNIRKELSTRFAMEGKNPSSIPRPKKPDPK